MKLIICYILIAVLFVTLMFMFLLLFRIKDRVLSIEKKYKILLKGEKVANMESLILTRFAEIDVLKKNTTLVADSLKSISSMCAASLQKVGIVKYDAFEDVGGNLSYALCMLDRGNNGIIINVVHSSDRCMTYAKEVAEGKVYAVLSEEEKEALAKALDTETNNN